MSGLSREVLKWLQSLDLTWQVKNPKWDISNGYLIAEIFSWYFPQDIQMHSFYNRDSLDLKTRNWYILKNFILKNGIDVKMSDVDGTIHCREGAATELVEKLYEILTNRRVKKLPSEVPLEYTDYAYQMQLPMHARATAAQSIKNNLRLTEVMADQNLITCSQKPGWCSDRTVLKSQKIINDHIEHRRQERCSEPERFGIKPTLGDRCVRRPEPPQKLQSEPSHLTQTTDVPSELQWKQLWLNTPQ